MYSTGNTMFIKNAKKEKKWVFFVNGSKNFVHLVVHFMKWSILYPFHEMDKYFVYLTKWTVGLSISQNEQFP